MDDEFIVKRLGQQDLTALKELIEVFREVFEMENPTEAKESYLSNLLQRPGFIVLVILHNHEVVAGVTAFELPLYYGEYSEVFIYDMAVKSEFQKLGLGRRLIEALKVYCRQNEIRTFFVEAHEEDQHAVNFYHSAGGEPERVIHFNFTMNKPG